MPTVSSSLDGTYYLSDNTQLSSSNITVGNGQTLNLNLNGYTLTGTGTGAVITVNNGGTLNLYDSEISGVTHGATGGTITGGTISGNTTSSSGGGVYMNSGTFNMTNGTSDTTFSPDTNCTRGQIVTFLYRAFAE